MLRTLWTSLLLILAAAGGAHAFITREAPTELRWQELVPPEARVVPMAKRSPFDLGRLGRPDDLQSQVEPVAPPIAEGDWMSRPVHNVRATEQPKVVEALNGKLVRLGGYVVPLDFDANVVKEFLLVPFVGACIHVPPPPANQIVYVKSETGFRLQGLFDPVYVTGIMRTEVTFTGLAQTGYSLDAIKTEKRLQ